MYACQSCGRVSDQRRCPDHQRGSPRQRGYGRSFERSRAQLLAANPLCRCGRPASIAHHDPPRRTLAAMGVPDPDSVSFLQQMCRACHAKVTAAGR